MHRSSAYPIALTRARTAPLDFRSLLQSPLPLLPPPPLLAGAEIASEGLKGRVFEFSLGDLNNDEDLVSFFAAKAAAEREGEKRPPPARNGSSVSGVHFFLVSQKFTTPYRCVSV